MASHCYLHKERYFFQKKRDIFLQISVWGYNAIENRFKDLKRNKIDRTIVVMGIPEAVDVEKVGEYHGEEARGVSTVRDTSTLLQ